MEMKKITAVIGTPMGTGSHTANPFRHHAQRSPEKR
jgi:hypothetical protein